MVAAAIGTTGATKSSSLNFSAVHNKLCSWADVFGSPVLCRLVFLRRSSSSGKSVRTVSTVFTTAGAKRS